MKKLIFNKNTENLVEIAMVFAAVVPRYPKLTDTDSVAWKQKFVEWANEFEDKYGEVEDFDVEHGRSYLEVVADFAKEKILEYGGVEECR